MSGLVFNQTKNEADKKIQLNKNDNKINQKQVEPKKEKIKLDEEKYVAKKEDTKKEEKVKD